MDGPSPRIVKETKTIQSDPVPGITFQPDPLNYKHFFIKLTGIPPLTLRPTRHLLRRRLLQRLAPAPRRLPHVAPQSHFRHQNLPPQHRYPSPHADNLGRICLDILKKNWSPALQMKSVLLSIQSLLAEPNPDDPLNNQAADEWKHNKGAAEAKARDYVKKYAKE